MSLRKIILAFILLFSALSTSLPGFAQVSLQTGSATFSLSMFSWQDDKSRLNAAVALSYSSGSGLKVNDVASCVGQGWHLAVGGVISRLQAGEPDDQQAFLGTMSTNGVEFDQDISKYPAGFLYAPVSPANGCPSALTRYPIYKGQNQLYTQHNATAEDRQLDYFAFQFNGKSGIFIIDTAGGGTGRSLTDNKMKITFQTDPTLVSQGIRTMIASFTIQDADGLIYKFTKYETTQISHADFCDANITQPMAQPKFSGGNVYHQAGFPNPQLVRTKVINSWYLSEVDDPLTHRQILLGYNSRSINNSAGSDVTYNQNGDYSIISHKTSITTSLAISSIVYPDGHLVKFTYAPTSRPDLSGDTALATVDISYQGRAISEYQLNTSYFLLNRYGTPTSTYQKSIARLCLRSVKKIGVDLKEDSPPYLFDYYMGSSNADDFVPPPFFYAKDIWGFYNGSNSVDYNGGAIPLNTTLSQLNNTQLKGLCFLNSSVPGQVYINPKAGYAKNGLLRQIIYPTGGTLTYQYNQNSGVLNGGTGIVSNVGGVHVTQTSSSDGGYSNGCGNPLITNYNYTVNGVGSAPSLWGLEMPVNEVTSGNHYNSEQKKYHWRLSCGILGCFYWKYAYPGILSQLESVSLTSMQKAMEIVSQVMGIVTIITDIMDVATIVGGSTGFLAIAAVVVDVIGALLSIGLTFFAGDNAKDETYHVFYNSDLNGASPLPTQFNRVEIVEGSGTMGKTVQLFTDSTDYPMWVGGGANIDFSSRQRFATSAYGLPKLITTYDVNGNIIKQIKNVYDFTKAREQFWWGQTTYIKGGGVQHSGPPITCCKCQINYSYSQNNSDWTNPAVYNSSYLLNSTSDLGVDLYGLYSGRIELDSIYERVFKSTDPTKYVETVTTYAYNGFNYQLYYTASVQSNGNYEYKTIQFPDQYVNSYSGTSNAELNKLFNNNILNEPIAIAHFINGNGYINENVTVYTTLANGNVKPGKILQQRYVQPNGNAHAYSPDDNTYAASYHTITALTYDASSNLTGIQDEGGRMTTNIYDYNDKYIVASVIDADPVIDMPAYTSFETSSLGGWTVSGTTAPYPANAITGTFSFPLGAGAMGSNSLSAPMNTAKPYILSFWATSAITVSGGATLTKSAPTINGFTYYEYAIAQGTATVTLSGSANIDELRLYPKMARMRTTTYDPLIGKTSECDENNRVIYYEYDNLGRMRFVKDEKHNAQKMYEYNSVSAAKQNGCPGTYYNNLITEIFTKTNCTAGYAGGNVSYSVPAARFSSSFSQADADAQAETYLLTYGQANANTNGSCILIYYNAAQSQQFYTQNCADGYAGGAVTYSIPANRYSSVVSQADADQQATNEMNANGQAYANSPGISSCSVDNSPDWTLVAGNPTTCAVINGTSYIMDWAIDMNPNSPTYNTGSWQPASVSPTACPSTTIYAKLDYENSYAADDGGTIGDIVVRFYSDAACTQPAIVNSLQVNFGWNDSCTGGDGFGNSIANGTSVIVSSSVEYNYPPQCRDPQVDNCNMCYLSYVLVNGNGYTIVQ